MAKILKSDKGFKLIECSISETTLFGGIGVCDFCGNASFSGVLIAVLSSWYCKDCFEGWHSCATRYEEDESHENNVFNHFNKILKPTEESEEPMDKLTLEHLAPYLPYGLKVKSKINNYQYKMLGACKEEILIEDDLNGWYAINIFQPILRPLSDLTKEIEHNGERFVPIIELFKLRTQSTGDKIFDYYIENDTAILRLEGQQLDNLTFKCFFEVDLEPGQLMFSIASETWDDFGEGKLIDERIDMCGNEMTMFQKLYEWHFDVFGLIEKGLAISTDTLGKEVKP